MHTPLNLWLIAVALALICQLHTISTTRVPMEIVEISSSQQPMANEPKKLSRHRLAAAGGNNAFGLDGRKGRQTIETHPARILYQIGVSVFESDLM